MRPEAELLQMTLEGRPVRDCSVTVHTLGGGTVQARIGGKAAHKIVEAIVRILTEDDDAEPWGVEQ